MKGVTTSGTKAIAISAFGRSTETNTPKETPVKKLITQIRTFIKN